MTQQQRSILRVYTLVSNSEIQSFTGLYFLNLTTKRNFATLQVLGFFFDFGVKHFSTHFPPQISPLSNQSIDRFYY